MTDKKGKGALGRRDLFRVAGAGAGAVGAAAVGLPAVMGSQAEASVDDRSRQRYRETEHVRKAYDASRF